MANPCSAIQSLGRTRAILPTMTKSGPLPRVAATHILESRSIRALQNALPIDTYVFRDERVTDFGVDGSIELIAEGRATNIRAQVQLKARSGTQCDSAGAVSVSVPTANLNYLLNGICPLYILYRPEQDELRIAWARDEWQRLEAENPTWRDQESITVIFARMLDSGALNELGERLGSDATLRRTVDERVNALRSANGCVVIESQTLAVTDSQEVVRMLAEIGQSLTDSGLAKAVIERSGFVPETVLLAHPRAALAVCYAHFQLAQYFDASAALRRLLLSNPTLDNASRSLLDMLHISVRRMLGEIDQQRYERDMEAWRETATPEMAVQLEIGRAWSAYTQAVVRHAAEHETSDARATLEHALTRGRKLCGESSPTIALLELTMQQSMLQIAVIESQAHAAVAEHGIGDRHSARVAVRRASADISEWSARVAALAERTRDTPQIHCEVRLLQENAILSHSSREHLGSIARGGKGIPRETVKTILEGVNSTLRLARAIESRSLELSAMQNLASALDTFGQENEATALAHEALRIAELCGCTVHQRQLTAFLEGKDRAGERLRELSQADQDSEESTMLCAGEEQMHFVASTVISATGIPQSRMGNVLHSLRCQKQAAVERQNWCTHVFLAEHNGHMDSVVTMFAEAPRLKLVCTLLRRETLVSTNDVSSIADEFRAMNCLNCSHRTPREGSPA